MTTIFTEPMIENKFLNLDMQITEIKNFIIQSARDGSTVTAVERELYRKVFEVGFQALKGFFDLHGNGDILKNDRLSCH